MSAPRLRCVTEENFEPIRQASQPCTISVRIRDVVPLLINAALTNRVWLDDFVDEPLEISEDLYEVLLAYGRIANGSRCL
jgi:hypothetical protein